MRSSIGERTYADTSNRNRFAKARIDPSSEIGPYTVIEDDVTIGPKNQIGPHVFIGRYTTIGSGNEIHAGAVLGDKPQDKAFKDQPSYLVIGDDNIIREYATIHRGTAAESTTRVGNDCFIMGSAHIGHNCQIADGVVVANFAGISGYVEIGERAFVSGGSLIHQFVRIGRLCMIAGGTRVTMDIPPFLMVVHETDVININLVGLRRAGLGKDDIRGIRGAYKLLYRSGKTFRKALNELALLGGANSYVQEMIDFTSVRSKRGIAGPPHRGRRDESSAEDAED